MRLRRGAVVPSSQVVDADLRRVESKMGAEHGAHHEIAAWVSTEVDDGLPDDEEDSKQGRERANI